MAVKADAVERAFRRARAGPHVLAERRSPDFADRLDVRAGAAGIGTWSTAAERRGEQDDDGRVPERHSSRRYCRNFSAAGEKCFPWRWMMPSGRRKTSSLNCTAVSDFPFTSGRTAGSGRIARPVPISF